MRPLIRSFVDICARVLEPSGPVYEFGAFQVQPPSLSDLRPLFPGRPYIGCDRVPGRGVDMIADLHALDLPDACAGTVLCLETLEHVEFCRQAIGEMYRVLAPGGVLLASSHMAFPIHHPPDYWRFTPQGFKSLLEPFGHVIVDWAGDRSQPHTVVGIARKRAPFEPQQRLELLEALGSWQEAHRRG